ncbi:MAG TPA: response regulator [Pyrinomonadaceae bacterium]|nr:response regulator [Pyrinomonadaceae bacterium]
MKKIVVIEDQQLIGSIYRTKFAAEGLEVEVATDGEAGLTLINQTKPDVVLLDWMLPKMNGIEVLRKIRSNPEMRSMPVIIFSSSLLHSMTEEAWKAGATAVLSKATHSPKLVVEAVRQALASAVQAKSESTEAEVPTPAAVESSDNKTQVLLIEDHADSRALWMYLLTQAGHRVVVADSEASVLARMAEGVIDLFLINRNSANGAALSLCKTLSSSKPVVIYSASSSWEEQQEGLRAGAVQYLANPEDILNVGTTVSKLIEQQRAQVSSRAA